jgi:polyhydroxyalkanoate synthesis regulator phasin
MLVEPMSEASETPPDRGQPAPDGVAEAVRSAVERTMRATAGSATTTRERAAELVDDVVRKGHQARDQLARRGQEAGAGIARRGQEAGAELARRGQEATGEVGRRIELLERRLAELEDRLGEARADVEGQRRGEADTESQPEA